MRETTKSKPSHKETPMEEHIDFEKDQQAAREYAESVFSEDTSIHVEEGHELDFMRIHETPNGVEIFDVIVEK